MSCNSFSSHLTTSLFSILWTWMGWVLRVMGLMMDGDPHSCTSNVPIEFFWTQQDSFRKTKHSSTTDHEFIRTKISSFPPKWAATLLKSPSRAWRSLTSHTQPSTFQPAALQVAKLFSTSSPDLAHVYTETPNPASSSTIACLQDTAPQTSF